MIIEEKALNYLKSRNITGIGDHVYLEVPEKDIPDEYLLVEKTAGGGQDGIYSAMVAVQSISRNSLAAAMILNEYVKEEMEEFPELSADVYKCQLNSDYNYTNTQTKEYRYQAVFVLYY